MEDNYDGSSNGPSPTREKKWRNACTEIEELQQGSCSSGEKISDVVFWVSLFVWGVFVWDGAGGVNLFFLKRPEFNTERNRILPKSFLLI